jgi:glycosyltransferase involved in cell wall biosynthesis
MLVNPLDEQELADALTRILFSDTLREELKEKGKRRVEEFSWERCATETLQIYNDVYQMS